MPDRQGDPVVDEAHGAVPHDQVDAAGVAAAGRPPSEVNVLRLHAADQAGAEAIGRVLVGAAWGARFLMNGCNGPGGAS